MAARAFARRILGGVSIVAGALLLVHVGIVLAFEIGAPRERPNPRGDLAPPTSGSVTFVAIADVHARPAVLAEAFECARTRGADAILIGGDLANQNSDFEYRYGASLLANAPPVPIFLSIGNHEGFDRHDHLSRERFEQFFGPPVSWISIKGVLVVSIDSADEHTFSEEQARTVDAILSEQRPRARHAVILTHVMPRFLHPSIDKRGYVKHLDAPDSDRLRALCDKHHVELVLGGHFHGYSEETRGGTLFIMAGGGGGALDGPSEFYHYVRLVFDDHGLTHEVIHVADPFGPEWLRYQLLKYRWLVLGVLGGLFLASLGGFVLLGRYPSRTTEGIAK